VEVEGVRFVEEDEKGSNLANFELEMALSLRTQLLDQHLIENTLSSMIVLT
jgi:hypothetical protein